jgi:hypothetical protein
VNKLQLLQAHREFYILEALQVYKDSRDSKDLMVEEEEDSNHLHLLLPLIYLLMKYLKITPISCQLKNTIR